MPRGRNGMVGSLVISGAALAASIALAGAARWGVLPPLFDPSQPVLLAAVIIGLSVIASGLFAVVLAFYLFQVAALHEMKARLDVIDAVLKEAGSHSEGRATDDRCERADVATSDVLNHSRGP